MADEKKGCLAKLLGSLLSSGEMTAYEKNKREFYERHRQEQNTERAPCPSCNKQMRASMVEEKVRVFDCDKCRGLWLDERQLTDLFNADPPEELINPKIKRVSFYKTEAGRRKCPKCQKTLEVKKLAEVSLERCSYCKGAWLDHGEFHALRSVWLDEPEQATQVDPKCAYCDLKNDEQARRCDGCGAPLARR